MEQIHLKIMYKFFEETLGHVDCNFSFRIFYLKKKLYMVCQKVNVTNIFFILNGTLYFSVEFWILRQILRIIHVAYPILISNGFRENLHHKTKFFFKKGTCKGKQVNLNELSLRYQVMCQSKILSRS